MELERTPGEVVNLWFVTNGLSAPVTPDVLGSVLLYREDPSSDQGPVPQETPGAGVTIHPDPEGRVGLYFAKINTGDQTDEGFFLSGGIISALYYGGTHDGIPDQWGTFAEKIRLSPIRANVIQVQGSETGATQLRDNISNLDVPVSSVTGGQPVDPGDKWGTLIIAKRNTNIVYADAETWITADKAGTQLVQGPKFTTTDGKVRYLLTPGIKYFLWARKDGMQPITGQAFFHEADEVQ